MSQTPTEVKPTDEDSPVWDDFDNLCRSLMRWLAHNQHPHTHIIITANSAELSEGVPTAMLHFELWNRLGYVRNYTWHRPQTRLTALLDPLSLFKVVAPDFWIVSSPSGYKVQNSVGEHQAFFTMAADSKAYVWGKTSIRLKANSPLEDKLAYTIATGKTLWFEDCKKEKYTTL